MFSVSHSPLCRIRLGTFNVNGKLPSEDLYPWLRSSDSQEKSGWISPLKLSPLEVSSDLLHQGSLYRLSCGSRSSCDVLELCKKNSLAGTTGVEVLGDPDILVLGFQELDRSTEALLYTTSTLKEDEWLTAIFAGLGEKHVLYEKVYTDQRNQIRVDYHRTLLARFKATGWHATRGDREESPGPLFYRRSVVRCWFRYHGIHGIRSQLFLNNVSHASVYRETRVPQP